MVILTLGKNSIPGFVVDQEHYAQTVCERLRSEFGFSFIYGQDELIEGFDISFLFEGAGIPLKTADLIISKIKTAFIAH